MNLKPRRRLLSRWSGWFCFANILFLFALSVGYWSLLPNLRTQPMLTLGAAAASSIFLLTGSIGHFALLLLPLGILLCLAALIWPKKGFIFPLGIIFGATYALVLVLDILVYRLYHFHLFGVVWQMLISDSITQVVSISWVEWLILCGIASALLCIEGLLAWWAWRWVNNKSQRSGRMWCVGLVASLFVSYVMVMNAQCVSSKTPVKLSNAHLLVMDAQVIPLYYQVLGKILPQDYNSAQLETRDDGLFIQMKQVNHALRYPLHPLHFKAHQHHYNIVVIGIDTWRFDNLAASITPHIYQFAQHAWQFEDHLSGGDCTQPGLFSLFYGIPPTYWTAALEQHQGSLLIDHMLHLGYHMQVAMSAEMQWPAFDKTIFVNVPHLHNTPGADSVARDRKITSEFQQFIAKQKHQHPFFSFLFYDKVHDWCGPDDNLATPFQPAIKVCDRFALQGDHVNREIYFNRYKNSVHFVDDLVGRDLAVLKQHHMLNNTIVIITADHGEAFDDNHLGYWGHASNFLSDETHIPMIVYWPHSQPKVIHHLTTNYDIVPLLMRDAFGCTNPISDYSVGQPMLQAGQRPFVMIGSYVDFGIVSKSRVTTVYPEGDYRTTTLTGKVVPNAKLNFSAFKNAYEQMNRYFQ